MEIDLLNGLPEEYNALISALDAINEAEIWFITDIQSLHALS